MQLSGFTPGAPLSITHGNFRGIGFGGRGTVRKFDPQNLEVDLRVSKLLFSINVVLRFYVDASGQLHFWGGRPDGKTTGKDPAHVHHTLVIKDQTEQRSVFELELNGKPMILVVEKTKEKGADALKLTYDRYGLTLSPAR